MKEGLTAQVVGFRYFNVYGQHEQHKGRMASVAFHHFNQYREHGYVNLFGANDGYGNGEQTRDFVSVEDVAKVNLYFFDHPNLSGIYNLGTGRSQQFNELAAATVNACRAAEGKPELSLKELIEEELIRYIPFPDALKGKYQSFTRRHHQIARSRIQGRILMSKQASGATSNGCWKIWLNLKCV